MKDTIKDLVRSTVISICMSMLIFCFVGVVYDISAGGNFTLTNYEFTKMIVGCIIVGLGFGIPTIVYKKDSLPMPVKVIVHMGIGCAIYTAVAFAVGWIDGSGTIGKDILITCIQFAVAFVIWFIFLKHYKKEAELMNKRIQEMKK